MLHPYTQIEMIHSFQVEKRQKLLAWQRSAGKRPSPLARFLSFKKQGAQSPAFLPAPAALTKT